MSPNQGPEALLEGSNHNLSYQTVFKWDKSINRALISPRGGTKSKRGEEEEKKKRREEGKERRNSSSTTAGFSSDTGILSEFPITPEFCLISKRGRNSVQFSSDVRTS
ncbi:hypothetical protein M5K25_008050 [Dendrobium thyrsiflorum]|uniref:Uncharacterized protein n=1 Tax=Dendrobium thyrsiflorum TaxID=117978 RepID=A0ABD0V8T4_DENTH